MFEEGEAGLDSEGFSQTSFQTSRPLRGNTKLLLSARRGSFRQCEVETLIKLITWDMKVLIAATILAFPQMETFDDNKHLYEYLSRMALVVFL